MRRNLLSLSNIKFEAEEDERSMKGAQKSLATRR